MASNLHRRASQGRWLATLAIGSVVTAVALGALLLTTGRGHRAAERFAGLFHRESVRVEEREIIVEREVTRDVVREVPVPANNGQSTTAGTSYDARQLYNGIRLAAKLDKQEGGPASRERVAEESYAVELTLKVRAPKPVTSLDGLGAVQPGLPSMLPRLTAMLPTAKVSEYYTKLYANKEARLQRDLLELNKLLSRHNYYDCETILELRHPQSGRNVLLLQAEMDVVSDGSDGDRLATMPQDIVDSAYYQPTTSYGWPKKSSVPNPLIAGLEKRLKTAKEEYAVKDLSAERNKQLKGTMDHCTTTIADLKRRSFLIAEYDPFMVLPVFVLTDQSATGYAARVGDYAVILHEGKAYPAIVGDAGPDFKVGEASLRIGKQIDPRTNPYRRPINDLKATYLVFPGTAEPTKDAPDLALWRSRCEALLTEIGGLAPDTTLHTWVDILKQRAEEEARRKAEEEAKRKAEEEARKKAEAEAKAKAEEEAKRKAEEEARKNAAPDAPKASDPAAQPVPPPSTPPATENPAP